MKRVDFDYINRYYKIMGKNPIITNSIKDIFKVLSARKGDILVSNNRILRGCAKLKRIERTNDGAFESAIQFFALLDAFSLLSKKGIPVYFYNRIGKKKNGYKYRPHELKRMKEGLSFPFMYQHQDEYENELRDVFGELYSHEYVKQIGLIPQVIKVGSTYQHEDYHSSVINVENGKRVTVSQPKDYVRTIHIYGRCGVFGYAVEDKDTLPSQLQKKLYNCGVSDIRVVNHGLWGGSDEYLDHNFLQEAVGFKQGDIILFYRMHFDKKLLAEFIYRGVRYKEITEEWHKQRDNKVTFYDKPGHMNANGYSLVAKLIVEDLISTNFLPGKIIENTCKADNLNYYLKSRVTNDFEKEISEFVSTINAGYPLSNSTCNNGAIVMNCNPFTIGHRFLIETAAKQVDRLYIFVVEEDKSFFLFKDRFAMVKNGTQDIGNVVVVPSGKFIISAYTFPEYFMKDYVKEKNFDASLDVETFCRYIAPPLNIKMRFAGEEPFDPVTKNYNEHMSRILPEHGMRFVEIPRLSLDDSRVINATRVRELLKSKEYDELLEYVPQSTYKILIEKYTH